MNGRRENGIDRMFAEFAFCECNRKRIHRKRTGLLEGIAERIPRIIDSAKRCDLFDSNIFTLPLEPRFFLDCRCYHPMMNFRNLMSLVSITLLLNISAD